MNRKLLAVMVVSTVMAGARVAEALTITVVAPTPTTRIRHKVDVYVNAQTTFAITTAQATLDGTTVQLTPFAPCGTGCVRFFAELSPAAPEGTQLIAVEIADDGGATATTMVPFIFDRPVAVTLAMKPGMATGTTMRVQGTCDDNGAPCASLDLLFIADPTIISRTLVNVMAFDELFDLTPMANRAVVVHAHGQDGFPGGDARQETGIYVMNDSPRLLKIVDTGGEIRDTDLRRVLHVNPYNLSRGPLGLSIFDRAVASDTQIELLPTSDGIRLTPNGAVWQTADNKTAIYRNGSVEKLRGVLPHVAGNYVKWQEIDPLIVHLLDVATGAMTHVYNAGSALPASNGVLYYLKQRTVDLIRRDRTGETVVGHRLLPLATDGNLVVASPLDACGVDVYSSTGAVDHLDTAPCSTLQSWAWAQDGWVVYVEVHSLSVPPYTMYALRSRAPDGTRYLLADNLSGVGFEGSSPSGEVMFRDAGRRFLVSPGSAPVDVAGSLGRGMWRDGYWLVAIGDTLFGLDVIPPIPGPSDGAPDASPDDAPGSAIDAGPGAEADANLDGTGAGLRGRGGCGGCATGDTAPPSLLVLGVLWWLRRNPRSRRERADR
jgi:hypothetical protein